MRFIPPATPDAFVGELAKAILWMAKNPEGRAKMAEAGRQRAVALYSWRDKAKALLKIYDDVLTLEAGRTVAAPKRYGRPDSASN